MRLVRDDALPGNEHQSGTKRQRSWNRHKRSITSPILKDDIRENTVSQYFPGAGLEIRPLSRFFLYFFGNNACDDCVSLPQFDRFSRSQPALQALRVSKFADIYGMHTYNVPHNVSHCKAGSLS